MAIKKFTELESGKYKVLQYPNRNKYPWLIALEKLNPGRKESIFFLMERSSEDRPRFLAVGSVIIIEIILGEPVVHIQKKFL